MNISTEVKNAYKEGSHAKILTVSFPDINYTVPQNEVYYESMTLDEAIFDSDSFEAVGCIASQFVVSIRNSGNDLKNQKVVATISLEGIDDSDIPLFYGYVDSVDKQAQKKLQKITAYDALYSKGSIDVASWYNALSFPITLKSLRDSLFQYIGITQASVTLPADSLSINKEYSPNTLPALDVIKAICQLNGCFGIMNRTGTFEYRYVNVGTTPEVVSFYRKMDYKDYTITPVGKLTIRQNKDDTGVSVGSGSNVYIIQGNMFTYNINTSTLFSLAGTVYSHLNDVSYIPFEASNNGYPWIEVGDNCVLEYSVYDFEQSTPSQSVYSDVQVVVFKRTMRGIQNLIDDCSAEGKELQQVFISDVSRELEILQQTVNNLVKNMSTEITTYRNVGTITIGSGKTATIADLVYQASQGNTVIFHEEADLEVVADETLDVSTYTENDVVGTVRYYVNGNRLQNHLSTGVLTEGKHILNLMQFWEAGQQDTNRVQAKLTVTNGSVKIRKFRAQAYITVKQSDYRDAAIEVTKMPDKIVYALGDNLDFTGLVISKVYFDESIPSEDITAYCTFSPAEGSEVTSTDMIDVQVTYVETTELGEQITYHTSFQLSTQYLLGISVEQEPNNIEYYVNDVLDLTGISIVADYSDGTTKNVTTSCVYSLNSGDTLSTEGSQVINISYTENGITCTTSTSVFVMSLADKPIYIIDHDNPDNYTEYKDLDFEENNDLIKARMFLNASYSHSHNDVYIDPVTGLSYTYGPCTANFFIQFKGSIVLKYYTGAKVTENTVRWSKLTRSEDSHYASTGSRVTHRMPVGIDHNGWHVNLVCPEFDVGNRQSLTINDANGIWYGTESLIFKFNMSSFPVCGPITYSEVLHSPILYESAESESRVYLPDECILTPIDSAILGPSEFNGDVFALNSGTLTIISGPHTGHSADNTSYIASTYMPNSGFRIQIHTHDYDDSSTPAIHFYGKYRFPVNVKVRHVITHDIEDYGTYYTESEFSIHVPFTDLLYVGEYATAPDWAKTSTTDDV